MAKQIAQLLKTNVMADMDLKSIAQLLQKSGRGNDTILAHITKREADRLKKQGGSGTINPETGLPEFDDSGFMGGADSTYYNQPSYQPDFSVAAQPQFQIEPSGGGYDPVTQTGGYTYSADPYAAPSAPYVTPSAPSVANYSPSITPIQMPTQTPTENVAPPIQFGQAANQPGVQLAAPAAGQGIPATTAPPPSLQDVGGRALESISGQPSSQQDKQSQSGIADKLAKALGVSVDTLGKIGLIGAQGVIGAKQANKAQQQGQQATQDMKAMAAPYQQQGKELLSQAQSGKLSPAGQQQLQAAQAQVAQGIESRGGAGVAQAQAQIEALRQQLLNQQYQLGLQISNVGDSIATGAIKVGMQADQYVNQLTSNYFTNIARTAMGATPQVAQQTTPSNYGATA